MYGRWAPRVQGQHNQYLAAINLPGEVVTPKYSPACIHASWCNSSSSTRRPQYKPCLLRYLRYPVHCTLRPTSLLPSTPLQASPSKVPLLLISVPTGIRAKRLPGEVVRAGSTSRGHNQPQHKASQISGQTMHLSTWPMSMTNNASPTYK